MGRGIVRVTRVEPPIWLERGVHQPGPEALRRLSGEQTEWGFVIPQMFRVLADPDGGHEMLRAPQRGDELEVACGYWTALIHLMTYTLGWIRPERGILAWQTVEGEPTDDPRLELLSHVWDDDGMLHWLHAWLYGRHLKPVTDRLGELCGFVDDDEDTPMVEGWDDEQKEAADEAGIPAPISSGGYDPLHLSRHVAGPLERPEGNVELIVSDPKQRRAVLLLDSMIGWYRALVDNGQQLPPLADRSWRVEVVVRPLGSLGTYRRSRETGIWFAGRHRYHLLGIEKHTWR